VSNANLFVWYVAAEALGPGGDQQLEAAIGELMGLIRKGGRPRPPRVRGVRARALA
jgi:hypothetical protein